MSLRISPNEGARAADTRYALRAQRRRRKRPLKLCVSTSGERAFLLRPSQRRGNRVSAQARTKTRGPVREAQVSGEKVARSRGFEGLARAGFVARGLVYGI